jgi:phosphocarrier protein HPr
VTPDNATTGAGNGVLTREVVVQNRYGIHARPAALLVKTASRYTCEILLEKGGVKVNAKSIMGLLTLEGNHGAKMKIHASGERAAEALEALAELFGQKFFED